MRSANFSGPLKGLCPYQALVGPTQASGLAGGFDFRPRVRALANAKKWRQILLMKKGGDDQYDFIQPAKGLHSCPKY